MNGLCLVCWISGREDVYDDRMDSYWFEVRDALVGKRDTVGFVERVQDAAPGTLQVRISKPEGMADALQTVRDLAQPVSSLTGIGASDRAFNNGSRPRVRAIGRRSK